MAKTRLYLDEDIHTDLVSPLKLRSFDVLATKDVGNIKLPDDEQLIFAISQQRAIMTFNTGDYVKIHKEYWTKGLTHHGIIVSPQLPIGETLRRILNLLNSLTSDDMINRLEYLSDWR